MNITDMISITELSRIMEVSRPTVYKYISDYNSGNKSAVPSPVLELFQRISEKTITKAEIYVYCRDTFHRADGELDEIIDLLEKNEKSIDLKKIKSYILKEIKNGR